MLHSASPLSSCSVALNTACASHLIVYRYLCTTVGSIGGTYAAPILVVPEVAIGALGKFQVLPRYDSKQQVVPTTIMVVR